MSLLIPFTGISSFQLTLTPHLGLIMYHPDNCNHIQIGLPLPSFFAFQFILQHNCQVNLHWTQLWSSLPFLEPFNGPPPPISQRPSTSIKVPWILTQTYLSNFIYPSFTNLLFHGWPHIFLCLLICPSQNTSPSFCGLKLTSLEFSTNTTAEDCFLQRRDNPFPWTGFILTSNITIIFGFVS